MQCIKHLVGLNLFLLVISVTFTASNSYSLIDVPDRENSEQRKLYKKALSHLSKGQIKNFVKAKTALANYPLADYLEYHQFNRLLHKRSPSQMKEFKEQYTQLPVTAQTEKRWLKLVGRQRRWQTFLDNYDDSADPELKCLYARALYGTNQKEKALKLTASLWIQPESQPKVCDPLFEAWKQTKYFNETVVWSRLQLTIQNNERQLSRYLLRFLSGSNKQLGQSLYSTHIQPNRITKFKTLGASTEKERQIIVHGLSRLSTKAPSQAQKTWDKLSTKYSFTEKETQKVNAAIRLGLSKQNDFPSEEDRPSLVNVKGFSSAMADDAIRHVNWREVNYWSKQANNIEQNIKWDYWLARAKIELGEKDSGDSDLENIAKQRHYYGFMASSLLNKAPHLNDASLTTLTAYQATNTRVLRAKELFAVGDDVNGRREWYKALTELSDQEKLYSIYFMSNIGRTPLTIRTATRAGAQDHLSLRFPTFYQQEFRAAALTTDLSISLLYAVARQESAFNVQAVSSANARGLMQLIPSTAKLAARRMGLSSPSVARLHQPGLNIKLGSFHLAWLIDRYEGQTALAIAAYNAGETRVDRWTKNKKGMSLDIWIEQIPFKETRNYVKNVLAFRQVYSLLLDQSQPFLIDENKYIH